MNKFTIPAILVITVLVAGIFAFVPIDEASTVHTTLQSSSSATTQTTTLQANIDKQDRLLFFHLMTGTKDLNASSNANILPFKDNAWTGNVTVIVADGFGTCSVNEITSAGGSADGGITVGESQTGPGASPPNGFTGIDRLEAIITPGTDCTIVLLLDETDE